MEDMCVPCGNGILNVRVGAIIMKNGKLLMVGNERADYLYSVGGRIKMGETAEEAIVREVMEETGVRMEIDRLGFVHENYFHGDSPEKSGRLVYELSFYFYMKVPLGFEPICQSFAEGETKEYLHWVNPAEARKIFPAFFKTELQPSVRYVRHLVNDER
ncbi:MAG: NUDIX domain-containing protein [Ruminococcaceae bacterium]|nr:NUDIX domain-containing protein [Oscillospiraceae bacterium]